MRATLPRNLRHNIPGIRHDHATAGGGWNNPCRVPLRVREGSRDKQHYATALTHVASFLLCVCVWGVGVGGGGGGLPTCGTWHVLLSLCLSCCKKQLQLCLAPHFY